MNKIYKFETIKECEKEIIDKSIILDIEFAANAHLFECFVRAIRTIVIWAIIVKTFLTTLNDGFIPGLKILGILFSFYVLGTIVVMWVKYNYNNVYKQTKANLVDNIVGSCKQWQEVNYEEWEKKQMIKRFEELAN